VRLKKVISVTHYVILACHFNGGKLTFFVISFEKRIENDVQDDVMRDAKWSKMSHKLKWRLCICP